MQAGDHSFIEHESFVAYGKAEDVLIARLEGLPRREPVSDALYQRILAGFHASRFARKALKAKLPPP